MVIINILKWFYSIIANTNFTINYPDDEFFSLFENIMAFVGLVIPLKTVLAIFGVLFLLHGIRVFISTLKTIMSIAPLI